MIGPTLLALLCAACKCALQLLPILCLIWQLDMIHCTCLVVMLNKSQPGRTAVVPHAASTHAETCYAYGLFDFSSGIRLSCCCRFCHPYDKAKLTLVMSLTLALMSAIWLCCCCRFCHPYARAELTTSGAIPPLCRAATCSPVMPCLVPMTCNSRSLKLLSMV